MDESPILQMRKFTGWPVVLFTYLVGGAVSSDTYHVWEKAEITLRAEKSYENPYTDVEVWVDLEGPGFSKRCYGFWDGDNVFRVRVLATAPGIWTWRSGSNQSDAGLNEKTGELTATAWSEAQKEKNPCRRGMVRASANGRAFEYADGTPFFLLGDTWWSAGTFRYRWYDDDRERPTGSGPPKVLPAALIIKTRIVEHTELLYITPHLRKYI